MGGGGRGRLIANVFHCFLFHIHLFQDYDSEDSFSDQYESEDEHEKSEEIIEKSENISDSEESSSGSESEDDGEDYFDFWGDFQNEVAVRELFSWMREYRTDTCKQQDAMFLISQLRSTTLTGMSSDVTQNLIFLSFFFFANSCAFLIFFTQ